VNTLAKPKHPGANNYIGLMQVFDLVDGQFCLGRHSFAGESVLPGNSILLERTPFSFVSVTWDVFLTACWNLSQQVNPAWVFVDASYDPICLSAESIAEQRQQLNKIWPDAKVCILSARAQHFYDNLQGCVYFPLFLMINYPEPTEYRPRAGRIGCLNRRNAVHRLWLMHHLLSQQLIDPERDVYSIKFTSVHSDNYFDIDGKLGINWFNQAQQQWPKSIETHPDNFPNDYSIDHPAWHTGISIITETESGTDTIMTEKTAKGILSKSCFSIYMADSGYRVLEDLGFLPRFFSNHAEDLNIDPVIDICKNIATESHAMEYRQNYIDQIEHNFQWFGSHEVSLNNRPWWQYYQPKLQQALDSL
jgi:hypothetical protein